MFEYFYNKDTENFLFYSVPRLLFTDNKFKGISCESKLLYGLLMDRTRLSIKNNWNDEDGKVYVYFKQSEVCEMLNVGRDKCAKIYNELEEVGLIEKKNQGQGKPSKIYVKNFSKSCDPQAFENQKTENNISEVGKSEVKKSEKQAFRSRENRSQEVGKSDTNNNNIIITSYKDQSNHSSAAIVENDMDMIVEKLNSQFEVDEMIDKTDKSGNKCYAENEVREIIDLMAWVKLCPEENVKVNGTLVSVGIFRERIDMMNEFHLEYILDCVKKNLKPIRVRRNFLLTCIYNALYSMDGYYANLAQRQFNKLE